MVPSIWIVIVNYRTADLVVDCLHSIKAQFHMTPALRAVVVDNDSRDGSAEKILGAIAQKGWHEWATVIPSNRNGGFAFGNNIAIREALLENGHVDYVVCLNPDTTAHTGAIRALVDFMDANPSAGIAGSRIENAEGKTECSAHNALSPLGELVSSARVGILSRVLRRYDVSPPMQEAIAHRCDWVSGASFIVRREVFEQIGLLDEGYFLYFEEVDFCTRARKAGWHVWFVPESRIVHFEGASTGIQSVARRRPSYWYQSRRRYFVKHFGVLGLIFADILWAIGRGSLNLRRVLKPGSGGKEQDPKWFALDLLWGDLRAFFSREIRGIR